MTRSTLSKPASKKSKVSTPSPKLFSRKQDIIPKPPLPPDTNVPDSTPPTKGMTRILDLSPPTTTLSATCSSASNHSSMALLTRTPSTPIPLTDLPIEATDKPSVLTVPSSPISHGKTTHTTREHSFTLNLICLSLTTLNHRLATLQHRHEHDFAVLTVQTGLTDVNLDTPFLHKFFRDHVDSCIHRNSSVLQIKLIRHYSEFVKPYINEFIDPRLNEGTQKLKHTHHTVTDLKERLLKNAGNTEELTTSMPTLLNQHDITCDTAIKNTEKHMLFERQFRRINQNVTTIDNIMIVANLPSMTATIKRHIRKLADLLKHFADIHNSLNNITRTDNNTHELFLIGSLLDNTILNFQNNVNTNAAMSDLNIQRLTVVSPDNVATTIHQLETKLPFIAKQVTTTDIIAENFHKSTNATINKLHATVHFVEN